MKQPLPQTWDLDVLFPGGSDSPEFASFLDETAKQIDTFHEALGEIESIQNSEDSARLAPAVEIMQDIINRIREADSFTACLAAANTADKKALQLSGRIKTLSAAFEATLTCFDEKLSAVPEEVWGELIVREEWKPVAFALDERRTLAKEKLPPEQEALAGDLAVDGYHGWGALYDTVVGHVQIPFEEDGKTVQLSAGQAFNKLHTGDRKVRAELFTRWEKAWADKSDFCSDALNHLGGFRIQLYKHRGWDSIHKEPLQVNRMSGDTLRAMWETVEKNKPVLLRYLERKAKLLGLEKLSWHDVDAPIGQSVKHVSYEEGARIIVEQFRKFSPKLADFAEMAFENRWIEAEDRPGKRPGGFCTSLPVSKQTRIFMTYGGMATNVSTLAHELGHAYHQHVMNDLPPLAQEYAMNVAETASTFAEMIVGDAAVKAAVSREEKLMLLEDKIQRSVAFFMNIHARFLFETNFYEERRHGLVSVERLNELMVAAQKEAYLDALAEYHPHFWASKLHFYITEVPFYNFPYTFGFLFSSGIYAAALKEGAAFEDRYVALLRDTGRMNVEELARKHLGADLTQPQFWQSAVDLSLKDVEEFLEMTK